MTDPDRLAAACVRCGPASPAKGLSIFERYLTVWVVLCIGAGIVLGKLAPGCARTLDRMAVTVDGAPVVSIPIAICLFLMMYPIMVKIDFAQVVQAGRSVRPVGLTLLVNWAVKPFTMYAISVFFLGTVFYGLIGPDAVDHVKMPLGLDLPAGATHGVGTVVLVDGVRMLEVPLWRSYLAGCILLGIAPCTAMVLVWGYLAKGNDGHTLVMVAVNSLTMLLLYGPLGGFLLGVGRLPVPWQALVLSIGIYVALPLAAGYASRRAIIAIKGEEWFRERFLHVLTPVTILALLATLVLLFSFKGEVILGNPLTILWIAVPLLLQTVLIFALGYGAARLMRLPYADAAPSAMIGASNHFEVAIATATMLFGLSSGAALATVVGVLIEVPVMLMLVRFCLRTQHWFPPPAEAACCDATADAACCCDSAADTAGQALEGAAASITVMARKAP
jgi:ACR3 family arsenite transporter